MNDLAVRRSVPGLPDRMVVYEGKHIDDSNLESIGARWFDNDELKCYLVSAIDEPDS